MSSPKALVKFIIERELVRRRKEETTFLAITKDPILLKYRFCNVHRNDDRVTRWIHRHWLTPCIAHPDAWFAMAVARFVNWPESLANIGLPLPWNPQRFTRVLDERRAAGQKIFTGAYMVHADLHDGGTKAAYLAERVLTPAWEGRKAIRPRKGDTLASFAARLLELRDFGRFMVGQIIADTKYSDSLSRAHDWDRWAISGPGSARGLNRVLNRDKNARWKEESWRIQLTGLRAQIAEELGANGIELDAQDLQNCLCEFDKYERVRLGEGRPRSIYKPQPEK